MEKIDKIKCILIDFEIADKTLDEAAKEILLLFSVVKSFYCWDEDCNMKKCENICISCEKYKGLTITLK